MRCLAIAPALAAAVSAAVVEPRTEQTADHSRRRRPFQVTTPPPHSESTLFVNITRVY